MPVPQHVLNWLYSVLTSEYQDVNRAYNDVAQALSQYPSLSPRTDVHTYDNGVSALLVHLSGTIPVLFRGVEYRFPVSLRVPHAYPTAAPLVYVTPTETMAVRPGQHVDAQGQVYHPYLAAWSTFWDKSTILDFLAILSDIFAKEPPVVSRQQSQQPRTTSSTPAQQLQTAAPPPIPPLPHEIGGGGPYATPTELPSVQAPPRPPPKPMATPSPSGTASRSATATSSGTRIVDQGHPAQPSRYDSAPPLPHRQPSPVAGLPRQQQQAVTSSGSVAPSWQDSAQPWPQYQIRHQQPATTAMGHAMATGQPPPPQYSSHAPWQAPPQSSPLYSHGSRGQTQANQAATSQAKPPPPDLLDDSLSFALHQPAKMEAPPIPPNPEKDALLRQLGQTLYARRQQSQQQNEACMAGLEAQRSAMASAFGVINQERASLSQISTLLSSNAEILRDALEKADSVIEGSRQHPEPNIDELLVAPTVVANQLYSLVAEERAISDTIFVLGRAVERGRVSPAVFVKTTRSLAREWYLKKALVRKIGRGMGLAT